jgi:hypothetical protein
MMADLCLSCHFAPLWEKSIQSVIFLQHRWNFQRLQYAGCRPGIPTSTPKLDCDRRFERYFADLAARVGPKGRCRPIRKPGPCWTRYWRRYSLRSKQRGSRRRRLCVRLRAGFDPRAIVQPIPRSVSFKFHKGPYSWDSKQCEADAISHQSRDFVSPLPSGFKLGASNLSRIAAPT